MRVSLMFGLLVVGTLGTGRALPRYERYLLLETTSETSANVSFGDVDGDGHLDIVLAKGRHDPLVDRVLLGDGRRHIRKAYDLGAAADRSYAGRLVDMNGDGFLDVVVSNDAPDPKLVYLNDGKGNFHVGSTYGRAEWETRHASVADFNGDGLPDIVVANRSNGPAAGAFLCFNRGKGRFDADCAHVAPYSTTTVTPADINHDGMIDLVIPHRDGGQSYVYFAGPRGSFADARRVPFGPSNATIRTAETMDFNRDGLVDIVAIDERTGVTIYFGQRDGSFSPGTSIADGKVVPYALAVADLDGDGRMDVIVGHVEAPSAIYFNRGAGGFAAESFGDNRGTAYGFAVADFDSDGLPDIAVARSEAPNILYFAGPPAAKREY